MKLKKAAGRKGATLTPPRTQKVKFISSIVLLEAAARNDLDEVKRLLDEGIDPNSCNEDGLTALHQCCIDHYPQMMKLLVEGGADVNATDSELWTPLHAAATCNHLDLVQYLIANGADLLAVNSDGNMPYDICEETQTGDRTLDFIENAMASRGITQQMIDDQRALPQIEMLRDLQAAVRAGYDVNQPREGDLATALHIASANGYVDVTKFLLEEGRVNIHAKDKDGWQPIHAACCWCHEQIALMLLDYDATLDTLTNNYENALELCDDEEMKAKLISKEKEVEENKRRRKEEEMRRREFGVSADPKTTSLGGSTTSPHSDGSQWPSHRSREPGSFVGQLGRQGSRRSFRSSVRRSSMREKKDLSRRDMKEEFNTVSNTDDGAVAPNSAVETVDSSLAATLDPTVAGAMANGSSNAPLGVAHADEEGCYNGQSDRTSVGAAVRNIPSYPMSPNNTTTQTKILPRATPEQSLRPTLSPDGSFSHIVPPQEFQNKASSDSGSSNAADGQYSKPHITNGNRDSSTTTTTMFSSSQHVNYPSNSSTTLEVNSRSNLESTRHSATVPGTMGPSSGTLAELKQKRVNERNQQQQVRSSLPPTVSNTGGATQKLPEDQTYRNSSNNSAHFSAASGGNSQQIQTAFNGSGQSYNQYNSNAAPQSAANYPSSMQQSHKQNRISAPLGSGDNSTFANSNPNGAQNQLNPANKHGVMSSSTSNLSNRYSDQQGNGPSNQDENSELHQSADAAIPGGGHHEKHSRKKNKSCKVM